MYETILVPIDGSDGGHRAIDYALDTGERHDATVHGIFVVDTPRYGEPALSSAETVVAAAEDEGRDLLADLTERGDDRGVAVRTHCCHGPPHEAVVAYAADVDADLAVLGCRGSRHRTRKRLTDHVDEVVDTTRRRAVVAGER